MIKTISFTLISKKNYKNNKSPSVVICVIICIFFVVTFVSGIGSWFQGPYVGIIKDGDATKQFRAVSQLILYILDLYKWTQTTIIVVVIYGFLNTFADAMQVFRNKIKNKHASNSSPSRHKSKNPRSISSQITSAFLPQNNPKPLMEFKSLDHAEFIKGYFKLTDPFRHVLTVFHAFITIFGVFIITVWSLFVWTVTISYLKASGDECKKGKALIFFYIHYIVEIALYFALWFILLWKLNRNHSEIANYKNDFVSRVVPTANRNVDKNNDMDKMMFLADHARIVSFLEDQINHQSPFAIFGCITPTAGTGLVLFTSVLLPLSWGMYIYIIRLLFQHTCTHIFQ